MHWRNAADRYGFIGQSLHWVIVAALIASYTLATVAEDDEAGALMGLHRSVGITILVLAILRLIWRLVDRRPAWPAAMPAYQRTIARATHVTFYTLLFVLPATGWMLSSAEGESVRYFGLFELPPLPAGADEDLLEEVHEILFNVLLGFAVLHLIGALKHYFWDRDHVLHSMLPARMLHARNGPTSGG